MHANEERLRATAGLAAAGGLDAIALNPGASLSYLLGLDFHLMERPVVLIVAPGREPAIVLPALEESRLAALPFPLRSFPYGEDPARWPEAFGAAARAAGLGAGGTKTIGVEERSMRLLEWGFLSRAAPGSARREAGGIVGSLRLRKSAEELARLRRAVAIAEAALEATLPLSRAGMSERELSAELTLQLLRSGSDPARTGAPLVAGGETSADPHTGASDRRLEPGDLVVVDWGACSEGYVSDLTRTFSVGEAGAEEARVARIVESANAAGRAAAGPGVACSAVDAAARAVIEAAGYGDRFTHRTGHGLGLECHEPPWIRAGNGEVLETGMTFTVEPGIYLPGRFGFRIEDVVAVTASGSETLSSLPRGLRPLG